MAQLVAHLLCKQGVRGSSPLGSTTGQRPFPSVGRGLLRVRTPERYGSPLDPGASSTPQMSNSTPLSSITLKSSTLFHHAQELHGFEVDALPLLAGHLLIDSNIRALHSALERWKPGV